MNGITKTNKACINVHIENSYFLMGCHYRSNDNYITIIVVDRLELITD